MFALSRCVLRFAECLAGLDDFSVFEATLGGHILHRMLVVASGSCCMKDGQTSPAYVCKASSKSCPHYQASPMKMPHVHVYHVHLPGKGLLGGFD